jgi:3-oxoacyl-[acyl-carrier protein] reductase
MRLKDQVVLITGGAQGIGRSIAETLAREGAHLALCDVNEAVCQATADELARQFKVRTHAAKVNVTVFDECEKWVHAVLDKFGKIDVLVNNAGITKDNLLMRMSDAEWDAVLAVNLKGPFNCTKAVARPMFKAQKGRIINIASIVGLMGNAGQANYSASKGGLVAMTKTCAREFASRNVLVNAIAPGFIRTAMTDKLSDDQKKKLSDLIPLTRLGEAQDVANAALFLASEESSYITGHVLSVNGGMYM